MEADIFINARRMREGYGTYFVCVLVMSLSFAHDVYTTIWT